MRVVVIALLALQTVSRAHAADFRVCADPNYLPFSNRAGQGFENRIAEATAAALKMPLRYTWDTSRGRGGFNEFLSRNLDGGKCDAVMQMPYGSQEELTTDPYYISSYVFVSKKARSYDLRSMDSPILHKVSIGVERDTPPEDGLKIRDLINRSHPFDIAENEDASPESMLRAVQNGRIDVMITWEPAIGAFLRRYPELIVTRVPNARTTGSPEQYLFSMSMAVRKGDESLKHRLDTVIAAQKNEFQQILRSYNVQLYPAADESFQ